MFIVIPNADNPKLRRSDINVPKPHNANYIRPPIYRSYGAWLYGAIAAINMALLAELFRRIIIENNEAP
jgi:hypothetical protein